jgi:ribose transport system substrate-binding protein
MAHFGSARLTRRSFLGAVSASVILAGCQGGGRDVSPRPTGTGGRLPAWDPSVAAGSAPDLPARVAKSMPNPAEFWQRTSFGMQTAAKDLGLEFLSASAEGDSARNVEQMEGFLRRGVGALAITPIDVAAQEPVARQAIERGVCTIGNVFVPSHCHDVASQYRVGYDLGKSAADYINAELGGEAEVLNFNFESIEALIPRFEGTRAGLAEHAPGAKIVLDTQPAEVTQESGFQTTSTALQQHPNIQVVLGADTWCLGALSAFEAAGKANDRLFFGGVDGEVQALDAIRRGGPYKVSYAWPMEVLAYSWVQFAADWLDGKSIPKVIDLGVAGLDGAAAIDEFTGTMRDPARHWREYEALGFLGNISYDTREEFLTELYEIGN